jgi:hypothetical protein
VGCVRVNPLHHLWPRPARRTEDGASRRRRPCSPVALAPQAQVAAGGDLAATAMLWSVWTRMSYAWAVLFGLWCLQSLLAPQGTAPSRRHVLSEVTAIAALSAFTAEMRC